MTTLEAELRLMKFFDFTQKIIVPNVTDTSRLVRFENDLLILTKSNYAHGIEIKVSKSDFKKDFEKIHIQSMDLEKYFNPLKHFSYAFPENLLDFAKENVDDRFGLYSIGERYVNQVRKPKVLFNTKWTDEDVMKLMRLGCMRIYNLKIKENERTKEFRKINQRSD